MYTYGTVTLSFVPEGATLRWNEWGVALAGLANVYDEYDYTGFDFTVRVVLSVEGKGFLRGAAIATPQATPQAA